MHLALHGLLHSIAEENYNRYISLSKEYNQLTNNNAQWDLIEHSAEQNTLYFSLYREKSKHAIIAVVFLVMSVEGLINEYGFVHYNRERFLELERLGISDKVVTFYSEVTGKAFPKDRSLYQHINELVSVRNTLVHSKSVELDVGVLMRDDEETQKAYLGYYNSLVGNSRAKFSRQRNMEQVLEAGHSVYIDLQTFLRDNSRLNR